MKKHVAILKGGWSAEREVSLLSGVAVADALRSAGYGVTEIDVAPDISAVLTKLKPDVAFNALHGTWGEDGCLQAILETLQIPYTHSGVKASALAMDKILSKKIFALAGIPCAEDKVVTVDELFAKDPLPRPFVVKPYNEGSSVGVVIVREGSNFTRNSEGPWQNISQLKDQKLMAERYLKGRELTVSVVDGKALTVTELKPKEGFYDYEAKYSEGMTDHIIPAELSRDMLLRVKSLAEKAHNALDCRGVTRSDFRLDDGEGGDNIPYILEINTQPGMTALSLVPEQARALGQSFEELVSWMIEDASCLR
jgi:D-alanine-D-alanine ligase